MSKLLLLVILAVAMTPTSPLSPQRQQRVQCVTEMEARRIAEETSLPECVLSPCKEEIKN